MIVASKVYISFHSITGEMQNHSAAFSTKYGGKEEEEGLDMEGGGRVGGERGYFFSGRHGHDKASLVSRRCHDLEVKPLSL